MAEELHYSTVVFKNPIVSSPKEKKEEETEYDEVKAKGSAVTQRNPATAVDEKSALHSQPFRGAAVCLGLLCALLVSAIIGLCVYFSTTNRRLAVEKENVSRERDRLNWNLQLIFQFDVFPVNKYCSHKVGTGERVCNSCQDGWMLFQSSCYLIVQPEAQWKTWTESQQYCKQENADLPVIGSQAEQEFIHNHTKDYYDDYHGYWIGLTDKAENGKWLWVNGSHQNLTDGFWNSRNGGNCVLTIPKNAPLANWNAVSCDMQNRWIFVMIHGTKPPVIIHGPEPPVIIHGPEPPVMIHGPEPPVMIHGPEPPVMIHGQKPPVMIHGAEPVVMIHGPEPPVTSPSLEPPATSPSLEPPATSPSPAVCSPESPAAVCSPESPAAVCSPESPAVVCSPKSPAAVCSPEPPAMIHGLVPSTMIHCPVIQKRRDQRAERGLRPEPEPPPWVDAHPDPPL